MSAPSCSVVASIAVLFVVVVVESFHAVMCLSPIVRWFTRTNASWRLVMVSVPDVVLGGLSVILKLHHQ